MRVANLPRPPCVALTLRSNSCSLPVAHGSVLASGLRRLAIWPQGATFNVIYETKNYGMTPAVEVRISEVSFLSIPGPAINDIAQQKKTCEMGLMPPYMGARPVGVLFPEQERRTASGFHFSKEYIDRHLKLFPKISGMPFTFINPMIAGCVSYRFTFDETVHKTPFMFMVGRKNPNDHISLHGINTEMSKLPSNMLGINPILYSESEDIARQQKPD